MLVHLFYLGVWFWPTWKGIQILLEIWFEKVFGKIRKTKWKIKRKPFTFFLLGLCSPATLFLLAVGPSLFPFSLAPAWAGLGSSRGRAPSLRWRWRLDPACQPYLLLHVRNRAGRYRRHRIPKTPGFLLVISSSPPYIGSPKPPPFVLFINLQRSCPSLRPQAWWTLGHRRRLRFVEYVTPSPP
jgi:hypothetical protein